MCQLAHRRNPGVGVVAVVGQGRRGAHSVQSVVVRGSTV
jgi:hypothetical protein